MNSDSWIPLAAEAQRVIRSVQADPNSAPRQVVARAVEDLVRLTAETYDREAKSYIEARTAQPWERDAYMEAVLLETVRSLVADRQLAVAGDRWRLLDVGAGYGRDAMRLARQPDIDVVAVDNSESFVRHLGELQRQGQLGPKAVLRRDMRDLSGIADATFQCVRNHATLHHLPIVPFDLGADSAVAEARRVLVRGGVFYVLVKAGEGIRFIDTQEGIGGRFFQLFTPVMLTSLLERHSLSIVRLERLLERRASGDVDWIFALAVAV